MKNKIRWLYVILGILIFICLGTVYSWSIFRKPLEKALGLNSTQSSLPFMTFLAFYAFLMPLGGKLISKYSPKIVLIIGSLLVGLGWLGSAYSKNIFMLTVTYGVIAGSGVGIAYGVPIGVVSKWFPDKKGLSLGILLSGFGMSPFVTAPIAKKLIDIYGVFTTFKILGIIFLIILIILSLPFKFPNENININSEGFYSLSPKEMLKNYRFYILWICFAIATFVGLMIIGITGPMGEDVVGIPSTTMALYVSLFSIFNGIGRPLFGYLSDKLGASKVILLSYTLIFFASLSILFFNKGSILLFVLSFIIFWMNFGGWLSIAPTLTSKFFGPKYYSENYGIVFTAYGIGAILGNLTSGLAKDLFGSYRFVSYPILILIIIGIILSRFINKTSNA
ncbi:L-lactate MFS transporter [Caloramator proteoclasticus]|uniref:Nitrate/nitrite transporter NarK n=1 Tax=Caloramator proteoclasticus DSM 10124 TaxID=1121262 RepID=A0A1M4XI23_9CLOT|nr:OFA family MFS transporter [Caloramator proteoclasticus]SHE92963.1 Nitrate/nitrite transporter NarK [Caloramator proteoclasticus DSM 10124]